MFGKDLSRERGFGGAPRWTTGLRLGRSATEKSAAEEAKKKAEQERLASEKKATEAAAKDGDPGGIITLAILAVNSKCVTSVSSKPTK